MPHIELFYYMSDYFDSYAEWHKVILGMKQRIIKDHIQHYEDLENFLGFHYWLQDNVATLLDSVQDPIKFASEAFIHTTFQQNFFTASDVLSALEKDHINSARMMLRVILESIPKMYYMSFFPSEVAQIMCADYVSGTRDNERKEKIEYFAEVVWKGPPYYDVDNMTEAIRKKYNFKWYLKKIYTENTGKPMTQIHSHLNTSAHPSLARSLPEYNKKNTSNEINSLKLLLYYNIAAETEGQKHITANDAFTRNESIRFLDKMAERISQNGNIGLLFPDNPDIIPRFVCHPPGSPWE